MIVCWRILLDNEKKKNYTLKKKIGKMMSIGEGPSLFGGYQNKKKKRNLSVNGVVTNGQTKIMAIEPMIIIVIGPN